MPTKEIRKIAKEWKDATPQEIWEGIRDNFVFGFLGATLMVFISTRTDWAVFMGYLSSPRLLFRPCGRCSP